MDRTQHTHLQIEEISQILEPMIRRIIREELCKILKEEQGTFYLDPEMPLYKDMEDILQRKAQNRIILHSHEEVWNE